MRLITVREFKAMAEIEGTDQYNSFLHLIADAVSGYVESFLNRELLKNEREKSFHGGSRFYWLPAYPVDTAEEVEVSEDGFVLTEDEQYFVNPETGQVEFFREVSKRRPHILKVTWTGGFEAATVQDVPMTATEDEEEPPEVEVELIGVPAEVKLGAFIQMSYMFRRRRTYGIEIGSASGNMASILSIEGMRGLVPEAKKILQGHRRLPSYL